MDFRKNQRITNRSKTGEKSTQRVGRKWPGSMQMTENFNLAKNNNKPKIESLNKSYSINQAVKSKNQ